MKKSLYAEHLSRCLVHSTCPADVSTISSGSGNSGDTEGHGHLLSSCVPSPVFPCSVLIALGGRHYDPHFRWGNWLR